jgi:hypothetical protein
MTIAERNNKLKHFITCLKCEVSGKCCDDNCSTQYDAGNMGEIIENLEAISKALEQEPRWISVSERLPEDRDWYLGIFKEPDTGWVNPIPFICDYVGSKTKATTKEYWILRGFTDRDEHIDYYFNLECVAWRELPEPYVPDINVGNKESVGKHKDCVGCMLDKIRAEIEQHRRKTQGIDPYDLVGDCLDIIDKYKTESED